MSEDTPHDDRRNTERRQQPGYVNFSWHEGLTFLATKKYTGMFLVVGHADQGKPRRILIPNPEGW